MVVDSDLGIDVDSGLGCFTPPRADTVVVLRDCLRLLWRAGFRSFELAAALVSYSVLLSHTLLHAFSDILGCAQMNISPRYPVCRAIH